MRGAKSGSVHKIELLVLIVLAALVLAPLILILVRSTFTETGLDPIAPLRLTADPGFTRTLVNTVLLGFWSCWEPPLLPCPWPCLRHEPL